MSSLAHEYIPLFEKEPEFKKGMLWDNKYLEWVNPENLSEYLERFGDEVQQEIYKNTYIK